MLTVHPSIALECMLALLARGYSLHVEASEGKVMIRAKNKDKHSFQISKEASKLIKEHTGIDITEKISSSKGRREKKEQQETAGLSTYPSING